MPPQPSERWPAAIHTAFAELDPLMRSGERAAVTERYDHIVALLAGLEAASPDLLARRQIAYAYFDLTSISEWLGRTEDARGHYKAARDRWAAILAEVPADFEAVTQSAGCCNRLALLSMDGRRWEEAAVEFRAALAHRAAAFSAHPDHPEQPDNLVYRAGTLCNLGHLYREQGDHEQAARHYDASITALTSLLPPPHSPQDEEICNHWRDMWTQIYGLPHWVRIAEQFLANARHGRQLLVAPFSAGEA